MTRHDQIRTFLRDELGRDLEHVGNADSLLESGVLDSLGVMRLAAFLESTFGIQVTEDDLMPEYFDTVDAVVDLLRVKAERSSA